MYYINDELAPTVDRYDLQKFIDPNYDFTDFISSYFINKVTSLPIGGTRIVQGEGGKPDLLSFRIYDSTQYWWILMLYNSLFNPIDLTEGMTIKYPKKSDLETLYFQLTAYSVSE